MWEHQNGNNTINNNSKSYSYKILFFLFREKCNHQEAKVHQRNEGEQKKWVNHITPHQPYSHPIAAMSFVYIFHNVSDFMLCVANDVQNVTQMHRISAYDNLCIHLGCHLNKKLDLQTDDTELANAIAFPSTSGHVLGILEHYCQLSNSPQL